MSEAEMGGVSAPVVPSPCVGVCTLRGDTCYGCGRTSDEIATWADLSPAGQSAVWAELPSRLAAFGFRSFRLAATHHVVAAFIPRTFQQATGRWRIVTPAVEGHLHVGPQDRPATNNAGLAADFPVRAHEKVRVFGFQRDPDRAGMDTAVFVLPKGLAAREAETLAPPYETAVELAAPDAYSRAWLVGARSDLDNVAAVFEGLDWAATAARLPDVLAGSDIRLSIANALGTIDTRNPVLVAEPPADDANAPTDIKIAKAFVAGAIFEADDPDWLAAALAPA